MAQHPITLALLTWKSPLTLGRTLSSLAPIQDLFGECLVVCQEGDPEEIALCEKYGFLAVSTPVNLGIQGGIEHAVKSASNPVVVFLENDCGYIGGDGGRAALEDVVHHFQSGKFDVIRLQARGLKKFRRYWRLRDGVVRRRLYGCLRWQEANSCRAQELFVKNHIPAPSDSLKRISEHLWVTDSRSISWVNRPFVVKRNWFLEVLIPFANSRCHARSVNGLPDLEVPINSRGGRGWWRSQRFAIGLVKNDLFGHSRYDRPEDDEKVQKGVIAMPAAEAAEGPPL
jgi:glycosyltransferase involved in cell wall biosynthesis